MAIAARLGTAQSRGDNGASRERGKEPVKRVLLVVVATVLLWSFTRSAGVGATAAATSPVTVVFIPGLCAWSYADRYCHGRIDAAARGRATFAALLGALHDKHIAYNAVYFSYNPLDPAHYTVGDTHSAIARSVLALDQAVRRIRAVHPSARIDLVGYSLGGLVAASWAVTDGRTDVGSPLSAVHSIVTFDSPVRGLKVLSVLSVLQRVFSGSVWYDLQPHSLVVRQITAFGNRWWRSAGHFHSIANRADLIVPPSAALLGDGRTVNDSVCPQDYAVIHSCHGSVMSDLKTNRWVACHWIAGSNACAVSTVKPTATPTATVPVTAAPTATSTRTATAIPTAVATASPVPTPLATVSATPPPVPQLASVH